MVIAPWMLQKLNVGAQNQMNVRGQRLFFCFMTFVYLCQKGLPTEILNIPALPEKYWPTLRKIHDLIISIKN